MTSLLLLRHAKSSWTDPNLADFDRSLADRGRKAAPAVAEELSRRGWLPDHVLVSPSRRTRETWAIIEARLDATPDTRFLPELYEASAAGLLQILRRIPAEAETVLVIGHNPGMEELAQDLSGPGSAPPALTALKRKFPTAALARFTVEGKWNGLNTAKVRLTHFVRPKDLR
jgi:phosphohistidine phosphatase